MRLLVFFLIFLIFKHGNGTTYQCNATSSCGCSTSSTVLTRIVGGEAAAQGTWTWAVSLREYGSHICGASILTPYFIITAAHCVEKSVNNPTYFSILAGSFTVIPSSSNKAYQIRSIAKIYVRSDYDSNNQTNDIALLRLSSPLNMTSGNLKPICLPTGTTVLPPDNINMIAVGWGVTSMDSVDASPILRQVTVKSISSSVSSCRSTLYDSRFQFCAGLPEGTKDTCQGDSGGPLMAFVDSLWQLQGLTSYGYGCALANYPGVYTRVSAYISWIKTIIQSDQVSTTTTKPTTTVTTKRTTITTTPKTSVSTTRTTQKTTLITTTYKKSTQRKDPSVLLVETSSNATDLSNTTSSTTGTADKGSNSAKHSTNHSLFMAVFLPAMISSYSFILLFLL